MAISKVILNGVTQMDVTQKTVTAGSMLSGTTALKNDGTSITGTIATNTASDLTSSGATVTVPAGYYASEATKSVASGSAKPSTTLSGNNATITVGENALTLSKSITNMPTVTAGYISSGTSGNTNVSLTASVAVRSSSALTVSGNTVTAPAGYYASQASKSVASGTEGTPTASKGTVSNHSISVTPSVTNTTGYIAGSTKTGTAVTVSASELVSGTKSITENGTGIDVTNYAAVDVAVPAPAPSLITKTITANGQYNAAADNADGYSTVNVNVSGGGGDAEAPEKQVNFIDYDGKILHSYTATEANALTALPANPYHAGLTSQGWNWTLAEIKAQLTAMPNGAIWVGQMYVTTSGATEIDIVLDVASTLSPTLVIAVNGTATIDWGDNASSTITGTSINVTEQMQHTYANTGAYTIKISGASIAFVRSGATANSSLFYDGTESNASAIYSKAVRAIRLGSNFVGFSTYALTRVMGLKTITIPQGTSFSGTYNFSSCFSLKSLTIPSGVGALGGYFCDGCGSLESVSMPPSVRPTANYPFRNCYSLKSICIPKDAVSIGTYAFYCCYSLRGFYAFPDGATGVSSYFMYDCYCVSSITIPSSVTSISTYAFYYCLGMSEYHLKPTTPPTLANVNAFSSIPVSCKIYVPYSADHSVLNAYKTASNWVTYADYIVEEPT